MQDEFQEQLKAEFQQEDPAVQEQLKAVVRKLKAELRRTSSAHVAKQYAEGLAPRAIVLLVEHGGQCKCAECEDAFAKIRPANMQSTP